MAMTESQTQSETISITASAASKVAELLDREDVVESVHGVELRVDRMSAPYLKGSEIDYLDTLEQSGFTINNPNAKGTCACGDSAQF